MTKKIPLPPTSSSKQIWCKFSSFSTNYKTCCCVILNNLRVKFSFMKTRFLLVFDRKGLLTNFINKKDPVLKEEFHTKYKKYRNLLSTLMKKSKQAYYDKYFERNWNNIKNTWKGIKSLISLKTVASHVSTVLSLDNQSL